MPRTAAAALLATLAAAVVAAERPAPGPDPAALVAQLGSPEFRKREAAAKALDALGAAALPALEKALAGSADAELTERAEDLHARITRRVENARLIAPTLVELDLTDASTVDALAAVEKQSGYRFFLPTDAARAVREKKVTLRTGGKVPFWEAVDRVCAAAGLRVIGTGLPQPDPRYLARSSTTPFQAAPLGVPAAGAAGFVPAVPAAPKPDDPEAKKKAAEKQAALEKAAKDLDAVNDFWKGIEKQAERALQPGQMPPKAAPPPLPVPPPAPRVNPAQAQLLLQALRERDGFRTGAAAPTTAFSILLAPLPAGRAPASTDTAVKVEALPSVTDYRVGLPADTLLVLLQATAEPKLGLEKVTDVRVTRAVTDGGRELVANMVDTSGTTTVATAELAARRQLLLQQRVVGGNLVLVESTGLSSASAPAARQHLLRLKAPDGPAAKLAELSGVLVGMVRTPPAEVVAVPDLYPKAGPMPYRGHQGATLKAAVSDENVDDTFTLDVVLAYSTTRVTPAVSQRDEALISDALAKAAGPGRRAEAGGLAKLPAGPGPITSRTPGVLFNGLVLTDAAGTPFRLSSNSMRTSMTTQNGERVHVRTFRMTAAPTAEDQGKPARLAFYGTWQKPVEVPFTLKDVPIAGLAGKK